MKKRICVVTGSRAEYGLFYPLLKRISGDASLDLQIVATGMHLSPAFGLTCKEIEKDFKVTKKVETLLAADTSTAVTKSTGLGIMGFADTFNDLNPDMVVALGDRFEIFSAVVAAFMANIPVAHLYGGELTEGAFDDAIRHSITKMSRLHFTSTERYRQRVIQLGEHPQNVFTVGALGLVNVRSMPLLAKPALEKQLGFNFGEKTVLVTYHPVTLEHGSEKKSFTELLSALDTFANIKIIFTKPNADTNGHVISELIEAYAARHPENTRVFTSLGQLRYLSCLKHISAVVGNSSSGIIEAPSFGIPSVNIGNRQKGRIKPASVIDCPPRKDAIKSALDKAFSLAFRRLCKAVKNPYGTGHAAEKIHKIIKKRIPIIGDTSKSFYDMGGKL